MKNTLTKVCLLSGLIVFSLSGCYGGGSMIVCQRPLRPRPHYMVHRMPPPPMHHNVMPRAHHHSSPAPSFGPNFGGHGGPVGHGGHGGHGGQGGHNQSAPKSPRK